MTVPVPEYRHIDHTREALARISWEDAFILRMALAGRAQQLEKITCDLVDAIVREGQDYAYAGSLAELASFTAHDLVAVRSLCDRLGVTY